MKNTLDFTRQETVLIIDDTPDVLVLMTGILRGIHNTKVANTGELGLRVASTYPLPDLVLLDIEMPDMDGYEVCRRLKADSLTSGIPVIFLTAKTGIENEQKGFDAGCVDYITKPISAPIVQARVKTHLLLKGARDFLKDRTAYLEAEVARGASEATPATRASAGSAASAITQKLDALVARVDERARSDSALAQVVLEMKEEIRALAALAADSPAVEASLPVDCRACEME